MTKNLVNLNWFRFLRKQFYRFLEVLRSLGAFKSKTPLGGYSNKTSICLLYVHLLAHYIIGHNGCQCFDHRGKSQNFCQFSRNVSDFSSLDVIFHQMKLLNPVLSMLKCYTTMSMNCFRHMLISLTYAWNIPFYYKYRGLDALVWATSHSLLIPHNLRVKQR